MSKWMVGALVVVVVALVAALLWELRTGPPTPTAENVRATKGPAPKAGSPPPSARREAGRSIQGAPPAVHRLRHVPTVEEVGHERMEHLFAGDVPKRLMMAAAPCYQGEPGRRERMTLEYTLRIHNGTASLHGVDVIESSMGLPRLERCVVDTLRELSWEIERAPNLEQEMETSISILDLKARAPRPEEDENGEEEDR